MRSRMYINSNAFFKKNFVVFDIETTGLSPEKDEIIQIAGLRNGPDLPSGPHFFNEHVKPSAIIPKRIEELTGITDAKLKNAKDIGFVLKRFRDFCRDSIIISHNGYKFDCRFLNSASSTSFSRYKLLSSDTIFLSKIIWKEKEVSHSLDNVLKRLGIDFDSDSRHCAFHDSLLLLECFIKMKELFSAMDSGIKIPVFWSFLP